MTARTFPFRRAQTTNSVVDTFATLVPTATKPSGTGVFDVFDRDSLCIAIQDEQPQYLQIVPFGNDANNETFDERLTVWNQIHNPGAADDGVWVPQLICQLAVTLGNIAATALGTDNFLADTITVTDGDADVAVISSENDTPAHILVHYRAGTLIQFTFDIGTAAGANCLWRTIDHK